MPKSPETYGFNLFRLRKKKGIKSQDALAEMIGVSRQVVKTAELGRSIPHASNQTKIAEALQEDEAEFWRDPAEFNPGNQRAEKVVAAIRSVLDLSGYQLQDIPDLLGLTDENLTKSRIPKDILNSLETKCSDHDFDQIRNLLELLTGDLGSDHSIGNESKKTAQYKKKSS